MKTNTSALLTLVFIIAVLLGCKKDKDETTTSITDLSQTTKDESLASSLFDDAFDQADEGHKEKDSEIKSSDALPSCATITLDNDTLNKFPRTITINFGTEGCTGSKGRERTGKILVDVTGKYREKGTERTIGFDQFKVDGHQIEGTKTVRNEGRDADSNMYFSITVDQGKITTSDQRKITWNSSRTRTWIAGEDTWNIFDDKYKITGGSNGVNSDGKEFTKTIKTPIIVEIGCWYITQGIVETDVEGNSYSVDYGDGTCDNKAQLTFNDKTYDISLIR